MIVFFVLTCAQLDLLSVIVVDTVVHVYFFERYETLVRSSRIVFQFWFQMSAILFSVEWGLDFLYVCVFMIYRTPISLSLSLPISLYLYLYIYLINTHPLFLSVVLNPRLSAVFYFPKKCKLKREKKQQ